MEKRLFILLNILWIVVQGTAAQSPDQNYVKTTTYLDSLGTKSLKTVQYYDGLGRPIQTVRQNVGPDNNGQDLITVQDYDNFGRESKAWLPVYRTTNSGTYYTGDIAADTKNQYGNDAYAYSEPVYEVSPLNRIVQQYGPGQAWRTAGRSVQTDYLTNTSSSGCIYYYMSGDSLVKNGYYLPGSLYLIQTTDEDNKVSYEFKDKLGRVVLQRKMDWPDRYDTYYVYDDYGNLRWVLPPMVGETGNTLSQDCADYGYYYKYDERNRCIEKKLPGCTPIYMVYDKADRLIFSQDGEQRLTNDWTFNKYDVLGRMILTGVWKSSGKTQADLNSLYKNTVVTESYSATESYNYTWNSLPGVPSTTVLQVNYYDNYLFLSNSKYFNSSNHVYSNLTYATPTGFSDQRYGSDTDEGKSKGLLTGTIVAWLYNTGTLVYKVFYYDNKGRMIQSITSNGIGGFEKEYINYSFTGKPVWKQMVHTSAYLVPNDSIMETYTFGYDHANRPTTTQYKLKADPEFTLSTLSYDNQGRLASKNQCGTAVTTTYSYNIRNWLTGINSYPFDEKLYYNESYVGTGNTPQYNGNISAASYRYLVTSGIQGYTYTYDGLNRLKKGQFLYGNTTDDSFTEEVDQYDKNGNIKNLQRYARISQPTISNAGRLVDRLTLNYKGNQITDISDAIPSSLTNAIGFEIPNATLDTIPVVYNNNGAIKYNFYNGIAGISYNVLNLPDQIQFMNGHSIRYSYDASGTKIYAIYQTVRSNVNIPLGTTDYKPNSSDVLSTIANYYCSNEHIVYEGYNPLVLKRILNPEGYAEKQSNGTYRYFYYAKDHLGNNRAVFEATSTTFVSQRQEINYYPFGMPFYASYETDGYNPELQPYKFGGKEYDEMFGLNWSDFGARFYSGVVPGFMTMDPLCEKYYWISPYAYCLNNPVNAVDRDGRVVIFINGMHNGFKGGKKYWDGFDVAVMQHLNDNNPKYIDGSFGGIFSISSNNPFRSNLIAYNRELRGMIEGTINAADIIKLATDAKETIKIITHSMGSAYAKGYVKALLDYCKKHGISTDIIEFEADFAPFQPDQQKANSEVKTYQFSHKKDEVAGNDKMEGAEYMDTSDDNEQGHGINTFMEQIKNLPAGNYKVVNGQIVPQ